MATHGHKHFSIVVGRFARLEPLLRALRWCEAEGFSENDTVLLHTQSTNDTGPDTDVRVAFAHAIADLAETVEEATPLGLEDSVDPQYKRVNAAHLSSVGVHDANPVFLGVRVRTPAQRQLASKMLLERTRSIVELYDFARRKTRS